jgi:hypothetical protein
VIDTDAMQTLLESYLAVQLKDSFDAATINTENIAVEGRKFH